MVVADDGRRGEAGIEPGMKGGVGVFLWSMGVLICRAEIPAAVRRDLPDGWLAESQGLFSDAREIFKALRHNPAAACEATYGEAVTLLNIQPVSLSSLASASSQGFYPPRP